MSACQCAAAGYCETHRRMMSKLFHEACKRDCFEAFAKEAAERAAKDTADAARIPNAVGNLQRLADVLKAGCDCDRADRARYVARTLAAWPKPETLDNGPWAVGVPTAPRKTGSPRACLDALRINGWRPHVFAEPGSRIDQLGDCDLTVNAERLGAWRNFQAMGRTLLDTTAASLFLLVQDDTVIVPGAREFLEPRLLRAWPGKGTAGFVSLYTASHYLKDKSPGCHRLHTGSLWGLCAVVFRREDLEALLSHPKSLAWQGSPFRKRTRPREPWEVANVDTLVGDVCNSRKRGMFFYKPSLAQHVAPASSIGHGGDKGRREAASVVGDWSIFSPPPPVRIECPPRPGVTRVGVYYGTTHVGGAEVWLRTLLEGLDRSRFDVAGIAIEREWPGVPKLDFGGIPITTDAAAVAAQSDVLIGWSVQKFDAVRRAGLPIVYPMHHTDDRGGMAARLAPHADWIIAVSDEARRALPAGHTDAPVIPNGIGAMPLPTREDARKALGIRDDQIAVAYVGRYVDEKDPTAAARCVAAMSGAVAIYHGYKREGEAKFRKGITSLAKGRVIFRTPADAVAETYAAADVFIHTPIAEAFGLTFLEAMQAGIPVVASNRGVIAECGEDIAELVEPQADGPTLAAAAWGAIADRERRARARDMVRRRYSAASMVHAWQDALERIARQAIIPGFFDGSIRRVYRSAVAACRARATAVEIGSYLGRSAAFFAAEALNHGKPISLACVDTWRGTPGEHEDRDYLPEFLTNVADFGSMIQPLRMPSVQAAPFFDDASIDFCFIDAEHTRDAVAADVAAWLPKCRGVIAGHDYSPNFQGVIAAVHEAFGDRVRVFGDVWAVEIGHPPTFDAAAFLSLFSSPQKAAA